MSHLETLYLNGPLPHYAKAPALDLTPCTKLQSVWLGGIAPARIALGDSCKLHLDLWSMELACQPVWATLKAVHMLHLAQLSHTVMTFEQIPLLFGDVQLDAVYVDLGKGQKATAGLAQAKHLHINGMNVQLHIPATNKWELLTVGSKGSLALEFENLAAFAQSPPAFALGFARSEGPGLPDLMQVLGRSWQLWHRGIYSKNRAGLHLCNCPIRHSKIMCNIGSYYDECQIFDGKRPECSCGACVKCLRAAGKMTVFPAISRSIARATLRLPWHTV